MLREMTDLAEPAKSLGITWLSAYDGSRLETMSQEVIEVCVVCVSVCVLVGLASSNNTVQTTLPPHSTPTSPALTCLSRALQSSQRCRPPPSGARRRREAPWRRCVDCHRRRRRAAAGGVFSCRAWRWLAQAEYPAPCGCRAAACVRALVLADSEGGQQICTVC